MKAQFLRKVNCEKHPDNTPSLALYSDGSGYCFSCQTRFSDIGEKVFTVPEPLEDMDESVKRILELPTTSVRGLDLHFDNMGYYIVWPDKSYYKHRQWLVGEGYPKYRNPKGVPQPWLTLTKPKPNLTQPYCVIIEGEINAMSLNAVRPDIDVYCPGSAGAFKLNKSTITFTALESYDKIFLVADKDTAGISAVLKLKKEIIEYNPWVELKLVKPDYNDILQQNGKEGLKKETDYLDM